MDGGDSLVRLGAAIVLSLPIGWERESGQKPAGLRTHLLVSIGCCLFVLISLAVARDAGERTDPGRIAAQVVTGIGFLGGGAILRAGGAVRGLTTAATIWVVAAIGMACGIGYYVGALICSLVAFAVLTGLDRWERKITTSRAQVVLRIRLRGEGTAQRVEETITGLGLRPEAISFEKAAEEQIVIVRGFFSRQAIGLLFQRLSEDVDFVGIERRTE